MCEFDYDRVFDMEKKLRGKNVNVSKKELTEIMRGIEEEINSNPYDTLDENTYRDIDMYGKLIEYYTVCDNGFELETGKDTFTSIDKIISYLCQDRVCTVCFLEMAYMFYSSVIYDVMANKEFAEYRNGIIAHNTSEYGCMWELLEAITTSPNRQRYDIGGKDCYIPKEVSRLIEKHIAYNYYDSPFERTISIIFEPHVTRFNLAKYLSEYQGLIIKVANYQYRYVCNRQEK